MISYIIDDGNATNPLCQHCERMRNEFEITCRCGLEVHVQASFAIPQLLKRSMFHMICDKITYGKQTLLTIYHQGFDDEIKDRRLNIVEKVGAYNLVFTEIWVPDDVINEMNEWVIKEEGLLTPDSTKNPYNDATCAYMIHYKNSIKPSRLFKLIDDRYNLNIDPEKLVHINTFIKKYTGFNIEKNPMLYGDVFIFKGHVFKCRAGKEGEIIVESVPARSTIIVRFKKNDVIVSTQLVRIDRETEEVKIKSDRPWTYHDIEIFINDELFYYRENVSYIRQVQMNVNIKGQDKKIRLNKIAADYTFEHKGSNEISTIGEFPNEYEEVMRFSTAEINKWLKAEKPDNQVTFMKPGQFQKAMNLIGNVMQDATDEIWVFDPYFTDINKGIKEMLDWIRILAHCGVRSKNVVFYCKGSDNALDLEALKKEIESDVKLSTVLRTQKALGIHFYQTISPIHDRFVLTESNKMNTGLVIGTSFNSLGSNHYCISNLSHKASKTILCELTSWMLDGENLLKEAVV